MSKSCCSWRGIQCMWIQKKATIGLQMWSATALLLRAMPFSPLVMGSRLTTSSEGLSSLTTRPITTGNPDTWSPLMRLPSEVWGEITSHFGSDGRDLRSMMSASRSTYRLLCTPSAVTRLHINLSWKNKTKLTAWPTEWFAKFPGVVSIGLFLNPGSCVKFSIETVSALPRNLRHLHLGFVDSISNDMLPFLPPFLLTLNLEQNYRITDQGFKDLPESLEALHLPENNITSSYCLSFLPTTLKSLSIRTTDEIAEGFIVHLPALTKLKLCGNNRMPGPSISVLPSSIKALNWALKPGLEPFDMALIPRGLLSLTCHIPRDVDQTIAALPPTLLILTITHSGVISTNGIGLLPRGLTSLELSSNVTLAEAATEKLPPNLQFLYLPKNSSWTPTGIMGLPHSIHTLKLGANRYFANAAFAVLPPKLYSFSCQWNDDMTEELVKYAPPTLRRLEVKAKFEDVTGPQSFDLAFSNSLGIPRYERERTGTGHLINIRPYDVHLFEVDPLKSTLRHLDVSPKNIPPLWKTTNERR